MARWGLLVHKDLGGNVPGLVEVLDEVDGTREEAEERMRHHIRYYNPRHPTSPKRKRLYRTADGWLLVGDGAFGRSYPYHFRVCELEWDSAAK
ncbi:hypothetical protein LHJ74_11820 [Streptomyces sp. N2-109]|uniref:Uncharacterized protein n=1 Tax=Streptomyces gossypii TaxID=2883101 RepID=A0ABT2JRR2_9ACTN|nr:hypothetical protein [Streptomyces gossypii]MCT2590586.1 hypothetical protein [Streptomyces gossypii]